MKIIVEQGTLSRALGTITRVIAQRKSAPILNNFWIGIEDNVLKLLASNQELSVHLTCDAQIEHLGSIALPAQSIHALVSNLPPGPLMLEVTGEQNELHIDASGSDYFLKGLPADQYPRPPMPPAFDYRIPASEMQRALRRVVKFAAKDKNIPRPILLGVLLEIEGGQASLTATDGARLGSQPMNCLPEDGVRRRVVLPAQALTELERALSQEKDSIETAVVEFGLTNDERLFGLRYGGTTLVSNVVDGRYPDWKKLLPTQFVCEAEIDRQALTQSLRRAKVFVREDPANLPVMLTFQPNDGRVVIDSKSDNVGTGRELVPCTLKGDKQVLEFNIIFLESLLATLECETITVKIPTKDSRAVPVSFQPNDDSNYQHIIVPMQLRS